MPQFTMSMYANKEDLYKAKSDYYESKTKDLQQELAKLKNEAYYMRYHIHQQGFARWCPKQKEKMESIVYDENDKVKAI
jgi:hypothetical protein